MVTNTTIYTRQLYVSLSSDTPDVDFHNGDEVYLIDTRQRVIYDEENSTWYPLSSGGGGGGDANIQKYEYVQAVDGSSWHMTNWVSTYFTKGKGLYWCYIDNTLETPPGRPIAITYSYASSGSSPQYANKTGADGSCVNSTVSGFNTFNAFVNIGAPITMYFIPETAFKGETAS